MANYEVSQDLHDGQGEVGQLQVPLLGREDAIKSLNCSNMSTPHIPIISWFLVASFT